MHKKCKRVDAAEKGKAVEEKFKRMLGLDDDDDDQKKSKKEQNDDQ